MKLSNDVEKYEIEVTKMVKSTLFFLTAHLLTLQKMAICMVSATTDRLYAYIACTDLIGKETF